MNRDMERKLELLGRWMKEKEEGTRTVIGDFNTRTGEKGRRVGLEDGDEEELERRSMNRKVNKERS